MYALVTLKDPYGQRSLESAGYRLVGFFPGRDREEVAPGRFAAQLTIAGFAVATANLGAQTLSTPAAAAQAF